MNTTQLVGPNWLVCVPTPMELDLLARCDPIFSGARADVVVELCGFGPIAAGINAARLIERLQPRAVMLIGIAGSYLAELMPGSANCFSNVAYYGIGAGESADFVPSESFGFRASGEPTTERSVDIESRIPLHGECRNKQLSLLTCGSASSSPSDRANRLKLFPDMAAEDMEGYSLALACRNADKPLTIVRGISNWAGDRDRRNWSVNQAMSAAARLATEILER